jgi:hypothetical protein
MKARRRIRTKRTQAGIALLISIFILLLISVVAIALIVSSGTESALAGNYRSSTGVYYAAMAGLEEARTRLLPKNPNYFRTTSPGFLPSVGTPLAVGSPVYVINPLASETVAPWDSSSTYPDNEYNPEFASSGFTLPSSPRSTNSIWNNAPLNGLSFPGPLYKWVRINAVSEKSLNLDVYPYDGTYDSTTPVFYDGTRLNVQNTGAQVLEITAFAALPNGSQKLLQYLVAPAPIALPPFLAALTVAGSPGNGATFTPPAGNSSYFVKGINEDCNGNPVGGPSYAAVGVLTNTDKTNVINGILPHSMWPGYTGAGSAPDVENVGAPPFPKTPSQLNTIVQNITDVADATVPAGTSATQTAFLDSLGMSPTNLMTVVAGDLDLTHWGNTGYGLLLVTGTYTMDPDNGWKGIILVIGQGKIINSDNSGGREFDGAVFVANTNNGAGLPLPDPNLGAASVILNATMQGTGMRYSSCWIQKAQPLGGYKVLSFHEVAQ